MITYHIQSNLRRHGFAKERCENCDNSSYDTLWLQYKISCLSYLLGNTCPELTMADMTKDNRYVIFYKYIHINRCRLIVQIYRVIIHYFYCNVFLQVQVSLDSTSLEDGAYHSCLRRFDCAH